MSCDQLAVEPRNLRRAAIHAADRADDFRAMAVPGPCGHATYGVVGEPLAARDAELTRGLESLLDALTRDWQQLADALTETGADFVTTDGDARQRFRALERSL